ncbi:MAG: hypothetical protein EHM42_12920, partial [Planctomycetaceae bacterium]
MAPPPSPDLGARIDLFLRNETEQPMEFSAERPPLFDGKSPADWIDSGHWAWHDTPAARPDTQLLLPPGALTVWSVNTRLNSWGVDTTHRLQVNGAQELEFSLTQPTAWLSAVTFLSRTGTTIPDQVVIHVANQGTGELRLKGIRLWTPDTPGQFQILRPGPLVTDFASQPVDRIVPAAEHAMITAQVGPLPLSYAAVELQVASLTEDLPSLWGYLRVKREVFDISGGWIADTIRGQNTLTMVPYLKTLSRMHINTGQIEEVAGYTDQPDLYRQYPMKRFNRMAAFDRYDRDEMLPTIHAIEFLGEPQYGGGKPVPPQKVWQELAPYQATRLHTSLTNSEERVWRDYAGLSDYPHYDAYRVTAPAADAWGQYDRFGGGRIRWGAPLETIGDLTRSLRDLSRPKPIAYWSQGAHAGWSGYAGRQRGSPTPDELR